MGGMMPPGPGMPPMMPGVPPGNVLQDYIRKHSLPHYHLVVNYELPVIFKITACYSVII